MEEEMVDKLVEMNAKYLVDNLKPLIDEYSDEAKGAATHYFGGGKSKFLEHKADLAMARSFTAKRFMAHLLHLLGQIASSASDPGKDV